MAKSNVFGVFQRVIVAGFLMPKLGSLKPGEEKWFQEKETGYFKLLFTIIRKIAQKRNISEQEALDLFNSPEANQMAMLADCADDEALISEFLSARQVDAASISSMIIKSRVSPKYLQEKVEDLNEAFGIDFKDQWQDSYTDQLPMQVVEELIEFVGNERRRWKKIEEDNEVATEEVGKAGSASPQPPSE